MDFLKAIQICSTTSFRGEVKPSAPCCKILWHVKDPLRYDRDTDRQNSVTISYPVFPLCYKVCLVQPEQKILVDEPGMIRIQMGNTVVAVAWDALYNTIL
jgi:hypothetical protein